MFNFLKEKKILFLILIFFVVFSFFFAYKTFQLNKIVNKLRKENNVFLTKEAELKKKEREVKKRQNQFNQALFGLKAKAILVKETAADEIFSKNKNQILPIASLTKIVNSIVALKSGEKYIYITKRALRADGHYGLKDGEIFKIKDAIRFMMIESVNDMASAISFGPDGNIVHHWQNFMKKMNNFVQKNQIKNTLFFSENGLDINEHILGAYSTAEDISKITDYFFLSYPELAKSITVPNAKICSNLNCHQIKNTNILLEKYPEIIFSKTGYTYKAGGSISVIVKIDDKLFTIVVLGSTKDDRFKALSRIIDMLKIMESKNF